MGIMPVLKTNRLNLTRMRFMRRKDRKHADNIIREYEVRHGISTNAEQYRMHVNRYFFPCKGFRHVRQ